MVSNLVLVGGMALVAGLLLLASGVPKRPGGTGRQRRGPRFELPPPERVAMVVAAGLGVLLVTRWPVLALAVAMGAAVGLTTRARRAEAVSVGEMAEALAAWTELLRDATGTPRGIEGVLVATAPNAPELIRPHVTTLAKRLPYESLDVSLQGLARDLDHPLGDLVVTSLRLSANTGGRQIRNVLDDLVTVARDEARMHDRIEVARARPRSEMRLVLTIMGIFVLLFSLIATDYLEPYQSPLGQMVLALVCCIWAMAVAVMARLGRRAPIKRFMRKKALAT